MFRSLHATSLPKEHVFTVTVGASSKMTLASWHLLEPADVISTLGLLNSDTGEGEDWTEPMPPAKDLIDGVMPDAVESSS